jgi:hypothetical protein
MAERGRHCVAVCLFGEAGTARKKLIKRCHDLAVFESLRRAVDFLPGQRASPRKATRERARDDFGDHSHVGVIAFPTFNKTFRGYVWAIGSGPRDDHHCREGCKSYSVHFPHAVELCCKINRGQVMPTWLRSLVNAFLGTVPGKTSRLDTATRMMIDADFGLRREPPSESRPTVIRTPARKPSPEKSD